MANIIFMGSPAFAVESLALIKEAGHFISAVVTVPDKPAGRKLKLKTSAVKDYALENNLNILQPADLNDDNFLEKLKSYDPDLIVVVAFRKLPKSVWGIPKYGTFNIHASLLPNYRGAAPINHAIINGESETGVTSFFLDNNIDTGKIILQEKTDIGESESFGELYERLKVLGAKLCIKTIDKIISNKKNLDVVSQDTLINKDTILRKAPKIYKNDCLINWENNTINIYNFIRGLSPDPTAFTFVNTSKGELMIKVYVSEYEIKDVEAPNKVVTDNKTYLGFTTLDGVVYITDIQAAGKKRMKIEDFLRGTELSY
ncbi:MAG: methionyl-tRNA formyltransferase [Bacteroidales bacterium]|jgi:methionyl-tRNA formyltransferase